MQSPPTKVPPARISLENQKGKTWPPALIILLLFALACIATYATDRVLRRAVVAPVSEAAKNIDSPDNKLPLQSP